MELSLESLSIYSFRPIGSSVSVIRLIYFTVTICMIKLTESSSQVHYCLNSLINQTDLSYFLWTDYGAKDCFNYLPPKRLKH